MRNLLLIFTFLLLMNACSSFHGGLMTGNASLQDNNFELIDFAIGKAKTTKLFGIGGMKKEALVFEAKKQMYLSYPLKKGQAYANVSVDFRTSFIFIATTTNVTITADIVQFDKSQSSTDAIQPLFKKLKEQDGEKKMQSFVFNKYVALGDTIKVLTKKGVKDYQVTRSLTKNIIAGVPLEDLSAKSKRFLVSDIYITKSFKDNYPYKINQLIDYKTYEGEEVKAKITGFGKYNILLEFTSKDGKKKLLRVAYDALSD